MTRSTAVLLRLLVPALLLLSARTPLLASNSPFGGDGKQPKPGKRALPAVSARALIQSVEKAAAPIDIEAAPAPTVEVAGRDVPVTEVPESLRSFGSAPPRSGPAPPPDHA